MMTRDMIEHWRELITASGRDLGPLSKALGKDRSYLSGVLAGRTSDPGVFTSMKLATELGITF
ncbi:helix-turn-helix transcriptional regulator [Pseudophaeobacter leonis]|uniref:helix-turn-helix transcriptional regulator n=1 Tax=Pseudophaeobacter leonis TaxID=1144477 RepID=UPI00111BD6F6|nr:helix-turn-helix transcriptional regulator [Pseudophaeobacter leonis]